MFSKTALLVFATLLVAQVSCSSDSQWAEMTAKIEAAIQKLVDTATNISNAIEAKVEEAEEAIAAEITKINNTINSEIANLTAEAEAEGSSISTCLELFPAGGLAVAQNLTEGAVQCVTNEVDDAKAIVTSLISDAQDINATFVAAKTKWSDCESKSSAQQVICKAGVVGTVSGTVVKDVALAATEVAKAYALYTNFETTMETCAAAALTSASAKATAMLVEFATCVASKLIS